MHHVGNAVQDDFQRHRDLLFNLLRRNPRPLGDDLDIVVRHIGIGIHRKTVECDHTARDQQHREGKNQQPLVEGKINNSANHLLLHRVLQHQRILNHLGSGLDPRDDLLHVSGKHAAGDDFKAPETSIPQRHKDPVAVVQVQNCGRGNRGVGFDGLAVEGGSDKHPKAQQSWILHFQADFRGAEIGVKNLPDVTDSAFQNLVGIGVQMNVGIIAEMNLRESILVHVADDPNMRQVRNGERVRAGQALHARRVCHLLVGDHTRHRGMDVDQSGGMVLVHAEQPQVFEWQSPG